MQHQADTGMTVERMVAVISGAFASTSVIFMAGFIALDPKTLDDSLRRGMLMVCIALPILMLALYMSLFLKMGCLAFQVLFVGGALFEWGVKSLLDHVYPPAGTGFIYSIDACLFIVINLQWWRLHKTTAPNKPKPKLRERKGANKAEPHAESDHPASSPQV